MIKVVNFNPTDGSQEANPFLSMLVTAAFAFRFQPTRSHRFNHNSNQESVQRQRPLLAAPGIKFPCRKIDIHWWRHIPTWHVASCQAQHSEAGPGAYGTFRFNRLKLPLDLVWAMWTSGTSRAYIHQESSPFRLRFSWQALASLMEWMWAVSCSPLTVTATSGKGKFTHVGRYLRG